MATESANAGNESQQVEGSQPTGQNIIDDVCIVTSDDIAAGVSVPVIIEQPSNGETLDVLLAPGQKYFFDFAEGDVQSFVQEGDTLTLTFADNSALVLKNFGAASSGPLPATLAFSNELTIDELAGRVLEVVETVPEDTELEDPQSEVREEQVATIEPAAGDEEAVQVAAVEPEAGDEMAEIAEALAEIETAAGDEGTGGDSGNTGFGFGSSFNPQGINGLEDVGPIDPTQLQYGIELSTEDLFPIEEGPGEAAPGDNVPTVQNIVANLDESNLNLNQSGFIIADFGPDTPGQYCADGVFSSYGSRLNNELTSGGEQVFVSATPTGYKGVDALGNDVFEFTVNKETGAYEYTQVKPLDHADGSDPDDVISLDFGIIVEDSNGDFAFATVTVNIADDAPELTDTTSVVDESDLPGVSVNGALSIDFGNDVTGSVAANDTFSFDGSVLGGNLTSGGDDVKVELVGDTYIGFTGADVATGTQIFTLQVNSDGSYEFDLLGTLDHADPNDPNDIIDLKFGVSATDFDGDSAEATIVIKVKDDVPVIGDSKGDVDETNLDGGPISTSDTINVALGVEVASTAPDGNIVAKVGGLPIALTSGLSPVVFEQTATGYKGTINGGAETVFEVMIDQTGKYTYTQYAPFDHPDGADPNDVIDIEFGVIITDIDGDSNTGLVTISVADDGPIANDDVNGAEEDQTITGSVTANDDFSQDVENTVTEVEFGGTTYSIVPGIPAVVGTPLGKLTLSSDGSYTFEATDIGDPDGTAVFTYTLIDSDGDSDPATLSIRVTPDGEPVAVTEAMTVDETNLTPGPLVINETLTVDFGLDGQGSIDPNNTFTAGGSLAGGMLTSGGRDIDVQETADGYVAVILGTTSKVFELIVQDNGDYSFELFQTLDHADSTDPNDLIKLDFGVTIADADGDTANGTITINVLDDAPVALDDGNTVLQNTTVANGNVTDNDIAGEDAPSVVTSITFGTTTIPVVAGTATSITGDYGTLEISETGEYTYTSFGTNLVTVVDEFTYGYTDYDGDTDTAELTITIQDIDTKPKISTGFEVVDETDLPGVSESGQLVVDYGADGPGTVEPVDGEFTSSGSRLNDELTSGGEPVTVRLDGDTFIGETPDGTDIFTLEVSPDGSYEFNLLGTLDHADPNDPNDIIRLDFGVVAIDSDEDATPSTITVLVKDDVPTIGDDVGDVDETNFETGDLTYSDTLFTDLGTEASSFTPANNVRAEVGGNPHTLMSNGEVVSLVQTPTGYEGTTPTGGTVFTLVMDDTTGKYVYTQTATFDHPDGTDPNDTIELLFDFVVENSDGDSETGTVVISVADDGPVANDDVNGAAEGQDITGSVTANDDFSEDNPNDVTQVEFNGTTYPITAGTPAVIDTPLGQLTLNQDGSYTFDAVDSGDPDGTVTFTYTLVDSDGDNDTAELSIKVTPDGEPIIVSGDNLVDETALTPGPLKIEDSLDVDFGLDGAGSVDPNGTTSFGGSVANGELTSNDVKVDIRATANGYEGVLTGTNTQVFELIVQDNGDYSFELFGPLDHADGRDPNDAIALNFGVTATDFGGDQSSAVITINVLDDAPIAKDDYVEYDTTNGVANGNVIANDDLSEDNDTPESADHDVVEVSYTDADGNVTTVTIPAGGSNSIEGEYGILTMQDDGTYSYTLKPGVTPPGGETSRLDPEASDVDGDSNILTKNGITVEGLNSSDNDLTWVSQDGGGIGLAGGSDKVWPAGESLNVSFADAEKVLFTITDIGNNNTDDGIDFIITFADGSTANFEYDIGAGPIVDKTIQVELNAADYDGKLISSVEVTSIQNSDLGKASFLLNDVEVTHPGEECILDEFEYVLQDGDGDQSTAVLSLKGKDMTDDTPVVATPDPLAVDETNMDPQDEDSDQIIADFGADTPGMFEATGDNGFTLVSGAKNNALTSNGDAVEVKVEGNDYVGRTANDTEIFRLNLDIETGEYEFTLSGPLDHADMTNANDEILLNFDVTVKDSDGDSVLTTIKVSVFDDGPVAHDDTEHFGICDDGGFVDGNVLDNDSLSQDKPNQVTQIKFGNQIVNVVAGQETEIDGDYGTLTINMDGTYSYQLNDAFLGDNGSCICETNYALNPTAADVDGQQESITQGGITVTVANSGNYDITWLDTDDGSGLGIDNLHARDSHKVWPKGETFDIDIETPADSVTITIAEIGNNNDDGKHGVDYVITFADGSTYTGEQQFVPDEIDNGLFDFTLNAADFDGKSISSIEINSINDGEYQGASFLLNNVEATCIEHLESTTDVFEYVLTDADGDTSSAMLTLTANPPQTIIGTDSDDVIVGGGDADTLYGGEGADTFLFESTTKGLDTIKDFDSSEGDIVDISGMLEEYDPLQDSINEFVFATESNGNTTLSVDVDGSAGPEQAVDLVVLENVTNLNIELATNDGEAKV